METLMHHVLILLAGNVVMLDIVAKPPIAVDGLLKDILDVVKTILAGIGAIFFAIDMIKHLANTPRDLVAIGKDILAIVVLIGLAWKADAIIEWGKTLF